MTDKCPLCGPLSEDDLDMEKVYKVFRETANDEICKECWHHYCKIHGGGGDIMDAMWLLNPWYERLWWRLWFPIELTVRRICGIRGYRE